MDLPAIDNAEDESDDLFSDDEQKKEIRCRSNVSQDASILSSRSETSLLFDSSNTIMPTDAVIPSTPLSLLPFLNKINEQWTSDLETPQAEARTKSMTNSTGKTEETPRLEQRTPDLSTVKSIDKIISDSPVIAARATRRRSKRRIFRSSISIDSVDSLTVTNNEDVTVNVRAETPINSDTNSVARDDATNVTLFNLCLENVPKHCDLEVPNKNQDISDNEESENVINSVPDNLNTSMQEFFNNASFSTIDELCSNTFNKEKTTEIATRYSDEENTKNIDKERNIEENTNAGFLTAGGASINISQQALFKAEKLFEDDMDETQNYESFVKRNCNEAKNKHLSSFSFAKNVSVDIVKEVPSKLKPLTENVKNMALSSSMIKPISISKKSTPKARTLFVEQSDTTVTFKNKTNICDNEKYDTSNIGFCTAHDTPVNSKQVNFKAKALFTKKSDNSLEPIAAKEIHDDNEIERQETKGLKFEFQTACGKAINISKQALSKAKALFVKELDDSLETIATEEISNNDDEMEGRETKVLKIGFQTGRNKAINISEQALSKAKALFAKELDDSLELTNMKEIYNNDDEMEGRETKVLKIGFQTGRNKAINISKQALSKAKALFAKELDDSLELTNTKEIYNNEMEGRETKVSKIGFQTARNKAINISEQALSKAKALFAKELDDSLEPTNTKEIYNNYNEVGRQEIEVSKIEFQTAHNKAISKQTLSKTKVEKFDDTLKAYVAEETNIYDNKVTGLEVKTSNFKFHTGIAIDIPEGGSKLEMFEQLNDQPESEVAKFIVKTNKIDDKVENRQEVKIPSIGFQNACGMSINISKQALSRAKTLFADELDCPLEMNIFENVRDDDQKIKKHDLTIPHGGLQTACSQQVPVSNNAALTARESFSNDCLEKSNSDLGRASLQKRKLSETNADESTPQGRNRASNTKKPRLSSEFQARKLFPDNPDVKMDNDKNRDLDMKKQASFASVADSVLGSPKRDAVEPNESDMASSPVIGRQPISRKRKSLGTNQRNEYSILTDKKKINNKNTALQENVVQESIACENLEDVKLNTKTQMPTEVAKEKAKSSNTESNDYGDTQVMMDFIDESTKILQDRLAAALEQEAIITAKRRHGSKQSMGYLYRYKQSNLNARLSLREIGGGAPPVPRSYQELVDRRMSPEILEITATTAATYRFRCSDFYGNDVAYNNVHGIEMEDGVRLILDENGYAGVWELLRAFLADPCVNPNLVPARWVENHYRWIVWKLASMDRMKFGSAELPRALTPSNVMAQLQYRYDREIEQCQRPAIRRILEKDDVASKRMILCVSSIVENNNISTEVGKSPCIGVPKWKIELTDGWYSTNACIDIGMVKNISIGKIREGTKLVVSGAELLNCDQGFYPLEAPADVCLKLHTNSTRRARWDAKLGYSPCSGPIPIKLRNVCPSGGLIGKMTIIVARVYPMLYHEKTASGDSIVRNAKSEEKARTKYEQQCWSKIEAFHAQAQDFQGNELSCETNDMAIQLSENYENLSVERSVSKKRYDELLQELRQKEEQFNQRMRSKLRESLPGPRQVSQLLKVRVCDENANAILSIWSPSEEVIDALKEGACVSVHNIVASGKRGTELQLTARRSSVFKRGKTQNSSYPARVCTSIYEIANSEFIPSYGEFDTIGLVCSVGPAPYGMKDFDAVHLAYCKADSSDSSYLSILFWQGIASYGYADILTVGSIVACNNLEWRRATSWNVPAAYCTERSTFMRNPRQKHLYESFENLRNLITDPIKYAERCTSELNVELQKKTTPTRYITGKNTPVKMYSMLSAKKKLDYTSPLTTPKLGTRDSSNFLASNLSIRKRLEKLQYYGEAPELSPLLLKSSKRISLDFRSPIRIPDVSSKEMSTVNQSKDLNVSNTMEKH